MNMITPSVNSKPQQKISFKKNWLSKNNFLDCYNKQETNTTDNRFETDQTAQNMLKNIEKIEGNDRIHKYTDQSVIQGRENSKQQIIKKNNQYIASSTRLPDAFRPYIFNLNHGIQSEQHINHKQREKEFIFQPENLTDMGNLREQNIQRISRNSNCMETPMSDLSNRDIEKEKHSYSMVSNENKANQQQELIRFSRIMMKVESLEGRKRTEENLPTEKLSMRSVMDRPFYHSEERDGHSEILFTPQSPINNQAQINLSNNNLNSNQNKFLIRHSSDKSELKNRFKKFLNNPIIQKQSIEESSSKKNPPNYYNLGKEEQVVNFQPSNRIKTENAEEKQNQIKDFLMIKDQCIFQVINTDQFTKHYSIPNLEQIDFRGEMSTNTRDPAPQMNGSTQYTQSVRDKQFQSPSSQYSNHSRKNSQNFIQNDIAQILEKQGIKLNDPNSKNNDNLAVNAQSGNRQMLDIFQRNQQRESRSNIDSPQFYMSQDKSPKQQNIYSILNEKPTQIKLSSQQGDEENLSVEKGNQNKNFTDICFEQRNNSIIQHSFESRDDQVLKIQKNLEQKQYHDEENGSPKNQPHYRENRLSSMEKIAHEEFIKERDIYNNQQQQQHHHHNQSQNQSQDQHQQQKQIDNEQISEQIKDLGDYDIDKDSNHYHGIKFNNSQKETQFQQSLSNSIQIENNCEDYDTKRLEEVGSDSKQKKAVGGIDSDQQIENKEKFLQNPIIPIKNFFIKNHLEKLMASKREKSPLNNGAAPQPNGMQSPKKLDQTKLEKIQYFKEFNRRKNEQKNPQMNLEMIKKTIKLKENREGRGRRDDKLSQNNYSVEQSKNSVVPVIQLKQHNLSQNNDRNSNQASFFNYNQDDNGIMGIPQQATDRQYSMKNIKPILQVDSTPKNLKELASRIQPNTTSSTTQNSITQFSISQRSPNTGSRLHTESGKQLNKNFFIFNDVFCDNSYHQNQQQCPTQPNRSPIQKKKNNSIMVNFFSSQDNDIPLLMKGQKKSAFDISSNNNSNHKVFQSKSNNSLEIKEFLQRPLTTVGVRNEYLPKPEINEMITFEQIYQTASGNFTKIMLHAPTLKLYVNSSQLISMPQKITATTERGRSAGGVQTSSKNTCISNLQNYISKFQEKIPESEKRRFLIVESVFHNNPEGYTSILTEYQINGNLESQLENSLGGFNHLSIREFSRQVLDGLQLYQKQMKQPYNNIKPKQVFFSEDGCVVLGLGIGSRIFQTEDEFSTNLSKIIQKFQNLSLKNFRTTRESDDNEADQYYDMDNEEIEEGIINEESVPSPQEDAEFNENDETKQGNQPLKVKKYIQSPFQQRNLSESQLPRQEDNFMQKRRQEYKQRRLENFKSFDNGALVIQSNSFNKVAGEIKRFESCERIDQSPTHINRVMVLPVQSLNNFFPSNEVSGFDQRWKEQTRGVQQENLKKQSSNGNIMEVFTPKPNKSVVQKFMVSEEDRNKKINLENEQKNPSFLREGQINRILEQEDVSEEQLNENVTEEDSEKTNQKNNYKNAKESENEESDVEVAMQKDIFSFGVLLLHIIANSYFGVTEFMVEFLDALPDSSFFKSQLQQQVADKKGQFEQRKNTPPNPQDSMAAAKLNSGVDGFFQKPQSPCQVQSLHNRRQSLLKLDKYNDIKDDAGTPKIFQSNKIEKTKSHFEHTHQANATDLNKSTTSSSMNSQTNKKKGSFEEICNTKLLLMPSVDSDRRRNSLQHFENQNHHRFHEENTMTSTNQNQSNQYQKSNPQEFSKDSNCNCLLHLLFDFAGSQENHTLSSQESHNHIILSTKIGIIREVLEKNYPISFKSFLCQSLRLQKSVNVQSLLRHEFLNPFLQEQTIIGPRVTLKEILDANLQMKGVMVQVDDRQYGNSAEILANCCQNLPTVLFNCERWTQSKFPRMYLKKLLALSEESQSIQTITTVLGLPIEEILDDIQDAIQESNLPEIFEMQVAQQVE